MKIRHAFFWQRSPPKKGGFPIRPREATRKRSSSRAAIPPINCQNVPRIPPEPPRFAWRPCLSPSRPSSRHACAARRSRCGARTWSEAAVRAASRPTSRACSRPPVGRASAAARRSATRNYSFTRGPLVRCVSRRVGGRQMRILGESSASSFANGLLFL